MEIAPDLALDRRAALPPTLRVLVEAMPRSGWHTHPDFGGLAAFWLDRHLGFRRLTALILVDAETRLDRNLDPQTHAARLSRLGGMLLDELHGHHRIEDLHFIPELARIEPRVAHGFDLLEDDHQVLDRYLADFAGAADAVIAGDEMIKPTGAFLEAARRLEQLLARHLTDEEELVVPALLTHGMR